MKGLVSVLLFTRLVLYHPLCFGQEVYFTKAASITDGPGYQTMGMAQDNQGYLWFATSNGLHRYDGHRYTSYRHEKLNSNSPAAVKIECITVDDEGSIWVAPFGAGLDRLDPSTGTFIHYRHQESNPGSLANDSVWAILEDREGTLWIGTAGGLDKFDSETNTFIHYTHDKADPSSLSFNHVRTIYEDHEGTLWVGTGNAWATRHSDNGGLNRLNKKTGKFIRYLHDKKDPHTLINNMVGAIFEDSKGNFWVGTAGDGLHTMDKTKGSFERHSHNPSHPDKLSRPPLNQSLAFVIDHITFITEGNDGNIFIGTLGGGINVYNLMTQRVTFYGGGKKSMQPLPDNNFWTAYKTTDNTIWISSWDNTLYKVKPFQNVLTRIDRKGPIYSFAEDNEQNLWFSTMNGLIHVTDDGKEEAFLIDKESASASNQIFYIEKDNNKFWLTTTGGLYAFDIDTRVFTKHDGHCGNANRSDSINTVKKHIDNSLWLATARGVDRIDLKNGTCTHYQNNPNDAGSLSNNQVITINTDRRNNVWICTDKGLNRFDKITGSFRRYLTQLAVISIMEDRDGNIWAATDSGLFKYDRPTDSFLNFRDETFVITSELVIWIIEDQQQNLWLNTSRGLIRLNKERSSATLYGENQGVNGSVTVSAGYTRANGEVLFGDSSGYFHFQPALLQQNVQPPGVVIEDFMLDNIVVKPSVNGILSTPLAKVPEIRLTHDQNNPSFQFANIDFMSEHEDTRLLYKMQNYDKVWRRADDQGIAYYFNVPPGEYSFKVKAINAVGIGAEKTISLIITPPWWSTWWAYTLAGALSLGFCYVLYRTRTDRIKTKQATKINIMVAAQEGERRRISRDLHDDVGTKLSALKLSLSSLQEKASNINNEEIRSLAQSSEHFIAEVIQDVRHLLENLSPSVLEAFGYETAVQGLVNRINETGRVHFNLTMFGMDSPLKKDDELALYRITQELIANVLRHAEAKIVSLQLGRRDGKIILMIEDDGKGFDVTAHKNGYGLHNLAARTELMHGSLVIDATPGRGTTVVIEIPY